MEKKETPQQGKMTLLQKLFEIRTKFKTFAVEEDAEKKIPGTRDSAYRYTPGWKIVEAFRAEMDRLHVFLMPEYTRESSDMIEYPVYKTATGSGKTFRKEDIITFNKRTVLAKVNAKYTWLDIDTGETLGPFAFCADGDNGTDKSLASAISTCERQFLLKFFQVTTREKDDEPDARDSDTVPGVNGDYQPSQGQPVVPPATPATMAAPAVAQPVAGQPAPAAPLQQPSAPKQPAAGGRNPYPQPPSYEPSFTGGNYPFDENQPAIRDAAYRLLNYQKGTNSHTQLLGTEMARLASIGFMVSDPNFAANLTEMGQALREGRQPSFAR